MSFLSVLIAYLLSRYTDLATWLQHDTWFNHGIDQISARQPASRMPFYELVIGSSALVLLVLWLIPFWLGFFVTIAALLYSLGRGPWRDYTANTLAALRADKAETVWLALESEGSIDTASGDALWVAIRKHASYSYLRDLFAVFFWFCVTGTTGAVFFCLLNLYNQHPRVRNAELPDFRRWQTAMEWLPARYMALCFCLAGNFNNCFWVWRQLALDTELDTREFLCRCLDAALVLDNRQSLAADTLEQEQLEKSLRYGAGLQDLLVRTEIIGLVGLALTVLFFH